MRKLLLAIVLGLTLSVPASSFAGVNAMGVKLPIDRSEPKSNVESGFVPETAAGSYQSQNLNEKTTVNKAERYTFSAFGVDLGSVKQI